MRRSRRISRSRHESFTAAIQKTATAGPEQRTSTCKSAPRCPVLNTHVVTVLRRQGSYVYLEFQHPTPASIVHSSGVLPWITTRRNVWRIHLQSIAACRHDEAAHLPAHRKSTGCGPVTHTSGVRGTIPQSAKDDSGAPPFAYTRYRTRPTAPAPLLCGPVSGSFR